MGLSIHGLVEEYWKSLGWETWETWGWCVWGATQIQWGWCVWELASPEFLVRSDPIDFPCDLSIAKRRSKFSTPLSQQVSSLRSQSTTIYKQYLSISQRFYYKSLFPVVSSPNRVQCRYRPPYLYNLSPSEKILDGPHQVLWSDERTHEACP